MRKFIRKAPACPQQRKRLPHTGYGWQEKYDQVDLIPYPGVETQTPLWTPKMTHRTIAPPPLFFVILTPMSPRIIQQAHFDIGASWLLPGPVFPLPYYQLFFNQRKIISLFQIFRQIVIIKCKVTSLGSGWLKTTRAKTNPTWIVTANKGGYCELLTKTNALIVTPNSRHF